MFTPGLGDKFCCTVLAPSQGLPQSIIMGLAGPKVKQRIPNDPRNLAWAEGT